MEQIAQGFDRNIDFIEMKDNILKDYQQTVNKLKELNKSQRKQLRIYSNRLIYIICIIIQLRNGSRISEAINAFQLFLKDGKTDDKVVVKIAKSESLKYNKDTGEEYKTKARFREMIFPTWITDESLELIKKYENYSDCVQCIYLKNRICNYMMKHYKANTHSLRYAFINFMISDQKKEANVVCKFVGHKSTDQLVRYTQQKKVKELFDMDI